MRTCIACLNAPLDHHKQNTTTQHCTRKRRRPRHQGLGPGHRRHVVRLLLGGGVFCVCCLLYVSAQTPPPPSLTQTLPNRARNNTQNKTTHTHTKQTPKTASARSASSRSRRTSATARPAPEAASPAARRSSSTRSWSRSSDMIGRRRDGARYVFLRARLRVVAGRRGRRRRRCLPPTKLLLGKCQLQIMHWRPVFWGAPCAAARTMAGEKTAAAAAVPSRARRVLPTCVT